MIASDRKLLFLQKGPEAPLPFTIGLADEVNPESEVAGNLGGGGAGRETGAVAKNGVDSHSQKEYSY